MINKMRLPARHRYIKQIVCVFAATIILFALILLDLYTHNFATVIPGQVYRSRELSRLQFESLIGRYHIQSVVNLRGANPQTGWYRQEIQAADQMRVKHYDIALNSKILPGPEQFQALVNILATAPRPLLIHCESGVDRSGFASAIALIMDNAPLSQAKEQVSLKYFVLSHRSVGKQFLEKYTHWLRQNHLSSSKESLVEWLNQYARTT